MLLVLVILPHLDSRRYHSQQCSSIRDYCLSWRRSSPLPFRHSAFDRYYLQARYAPISSPSRQWAPLRMPQCFRTSIPQERAWLELSSCHPCGPQDSPECGRPPLSFCAPPGIFYPKPPHYGRASSEHRSNPGRLPIGCEGYLE